MNTRISADQLHALHMKTVDAAKELTCEIEFALEVVRDGTIVDGNLHRRITEWNQALTELAIEVHGEARIPGGGLEWVPEEIERRRAAETRRETELAEYRKAQAELAAKQQEVAELAARLGLGDSATRSDDNAVTPPVISPSNVKSPASPISSSAAPATKVSGASVVVTPTVVTAPPVAKFSSASGVTPKLRECEVCRSRKGLHDFAGGVRCKQCYSDEMTVRRVHDTLISFGVKPLGERSGGESPALARMRKEGEDAKYALLARRQSSRSAPVAPRKASAKPGLEIRTQESPAVNSFKTEKGKLQDRWNRK